MPLVKAKKILNLPYTVSAKPPCPVELRREPAVKHKRTTEPVTAPSADIEEQQMNIFTEQQADRDAEPGKVHSLPAKKSAGPDATGKRKKRASQTSDHHAVQQDLFGEAKEEAS